MSVNASDIKSCLEYLEKHVDDDEEVEIILYQDEEEDRLDGGNDIGDDDHCVDENYEDSEQGLYYEEPGDSEYPTNSRATPNSTHNSNKPRSAYSNTLTTKIYNPKMDKLTTDGDQTAMSKIHKLNGTERNIDNSDDCDYPDETNDNDDSNYVAREKAKKDMSTPNRLGKYQCMICPYNSVFKSKLLEHWRKHSDERPYKCSACERAFKCKNDMRVHLYAHMNIKQFQCVDCDNAFTSSKQLLRHRKLVHNGIFKCTECDYFTLNSLILKTHMKSHLDQKPYKCSHCIYSSNTSGNLKRHMKTHTGEKPYECDICQSRFSEAYLMRYHRARHFSSDNSGIQCDRCPAKFGNFYTFRTHKQKLHDEMIPNKPYKCDHCERSSTSKASILHHMKIHGPYSKT